jgi:hypothetical protein
MHNSILLLRELQLPIEAGSQAPSNQPDARNRNHRLADVGDDGARAPPDVPHVLVLPVRPRAPHHLLPVHRRLLPALLRPLPPRDRPAGAPRVPAAALSAAPVPPAAPARRPPAPLGHIRRGAGDDGTRPRVPPACCASAGTRHASCSCTGAGSTARALPAAAPAAAGTAAAHHGSGRRPRELLHGAEPEQPHRGADAERPAGAGAGAAVGHRLAPDGADHRGTPVGRLAVPRVQGGLRARGGRAAAAVQARLPLRLHRAVAPPAQLLPGLPVPAAGSRVHVQRRQAGRTSRRKRRRQEQQERGEGERAPDVGAVGAVLVAVPTARDGRPRRRVGARAARQARRGRRRR